MFLLPPPAHVRRENITHIFLFFLPVIIKMQISKNLLGSWELGIKFYFIIQNPQQHNRTVIILKWHAEHCWDLLEIHIKLFLLNMPGPNLIHTSGLWTKDQNITVSMLFWEDKNLRNWKGVRIPPLTLNNC